MRPRFFISDALMFGSTSAVYAFNRCARAIWHIAVVGLDLWTTQFYDDFPSLEFNVLAEHSRKSFEQLMWILGWKVSDNPKKDLPFSPQFKMLGVNVNLEKLHTGTLEISNVKSRIEEIIASITAIIDLGQLDAATAASLYGRLNFALSSVFGKGAAPGLRTLSKYAAGHFTNCLLTIVPNH
jgi:hypothetical protein